jgi:hypothetical protein
MSRLAFLILFFLLPALAHAAPDVAGSPAGWHAAGKDPGSYEMTLDRSVSHSGAGSGCIKAIGKPNGFGTLMQTFRADAYRGKRIRMWAYAKYSSVQKWAGLWLRVDVQDKSVSFDNMQNRPLKGTQLWQRYSIVLDVPTDATKIAFGILLDGQGAVWVDDFQFEEVGKDVPVTDLHGNDPKNPQNLQFEEK